MRSVIVIVLTLLSSLSVMAQDTELGNELEALHAKWFKAFDSHDGAAMNQMEMSNSIIIMPDGGIWPKTKPRNEKRAKIEPQVEHTLSEVSVRRFGDAAILSGILTTKSASENYKDATMGGVRTKLR